MNKTNDKQQAPTRFETFTIDNGIIRVVLLNYGATVVSVETPDRTGKTANIVAGFSKPEEYLDVHPYFGSVVGRFANRISGATFELDGKVYQLSLNEKVNQLHGGWEGFDRKIWQVDNASSSSVTFSYLSADGEEGYPGNLRATVKYSLADNNTLLIEYRAETDKPTIVNLTNHSYFNLSGFQDPAILDHTLQIVADSYTVKNETNTSGGEVRKVEGTALDFRAAKKIGEGIEEFGADMGYDHNYVLRDTPPGTQALDKSKFKAATLKYALSGRIMNVYTDQPGMQVYTANWWKGEITGAHEVPYIKHGAVALETQAWPDSPNHAKFPSTILRPGEEYRSFTAYEFLVE
ncbi:MAG: aldose epimerase family protein [Chitinophagaceae bacterium]